MGAALPCLSEFVAQPAHTVLANLIFERRAMQVFCRVLLAHGLPAQFFGDYRAFGTGLNFLDLAMQRLPFQFGVEARQINRRVIRTGVFADPAIAPTRGITSGKMQQPSVVATRGRIAEHSLPHRRWN